MLSLCEVSEITPLKDVKVNRNLYLINYLDLYQHFWKLCTKFVFQTPTYSDFLQPVSQPPYSNKKDKQAQEICPKIRYLGRMS